MPEFEEPTATFTANGLEEEEARDKAYLTILLKDTEEQKKWLKWSKIVICEPLKDKDAIEKDIHMANTLEGLVSLREEIATNFNNFLRVQRTRRVRKNTGTKQTC